MGLFFILSMGLLASNYFLIKTLKEDFASELNEERDSLITLFICYLMSYLLRAFFFIGQGRYENFV
jgi:hypothetical protein